MALHKTTSIHLTSQSKSTRRNNPSYTHPKSSSYFLIRSSRPYVHLPFLKGQLFSFSSTLISVVAQAMRMRRRNCLIVVALSAFALGSPLLIAGANPLAIKFYNSGVKKYKQGDYQGALFDYNKSLEIDPLNLDAIDNRSAAKYQLGDYKGAIADADEALQIDPQHSVALNNRGASKMALKDYQGSILDYNKAISITPQYGDAFSNRCAAKRQLKDIQGAISDCSRAIAIDPQDAVAYSNRGAAKYELKNYSGAIADYNMAIKINPQYGLAYSNLGVSKYYQTGDAESSCNDFKKAASLGYEYRINWLNTEEGKWCRDM